MKNCKECDNCGCPECLGFGIDLSELVKKIPKISSNYFDVKDYNNLNVVKQRLVKELILKMITIETK